MAVSDGQSFAGYDKAPIRWGGRLLRYDGRLEQSPRPKGR